MDRGMRLLRVGVDGLPIRVFISKNRAEIEGLRPELEMGRILCSGRMPVCLADLGFQALEMAEPMIDFGHSASRGAGKTQSLFAQNLKIIARLVPTTFALMLSAIRDSNPMRYLEIAKGSSVRPIPAAFTVA